MQVLLLKKTIVLFSMQQKYLSIFIIFYIGYSKHINKYQDLIKLIILLLHKGHSQCKLALFSPHVFWFLLWVHYSEKIQWDFWTRWQRRQTWLTSLHGHIKITTKIKNSHHSELSEIKLNRSLTTTELNKPHPFSRRGTDMEWVGPSPHVVDKKLGGISREWRVPTPHQDPSPEF